MINILDETLKNFRDIIENENVPEKEGKSNSNLWMGVGPISQCCTVALWQKKENLFKRITFPNYIRKLHFPLKVDKKFFGVSLYANDALESIYLIIGLPFVSKDLIHF